MLVKVSILFFLLHLSCFGQNSFQNELNMLSKTTKDIDIEKWGEAQSIPLTEDSISVSSSALKKEELKLENNITQEEEPIKAEIKSIRKRSR